MGTADCGQLDQNPRDLLGLCSATSSTAPPHSPPTAKPCTKRRNTSRAGAQYPICANVGRQPIANVETPTRMMLSCSSCLRPHLSPKWPKTMPPMGRATKPTAYVTKAAMMPSSSVPELGKKIFPKTRGAAAGRKNSYHSTTVPAIEAVTTFLSPEALTSVSSVRLAAEFCVLIL